MIFLTRTCGWSSLSTRGSASASEILAGALKHHGLARGGHEYVWQGLPCKNWVPITEDTGLKITVARWLMPNGEQIPHDGIKPDVEVKFTERGLRRRKGIQMDKALELLK